MFVKPSRVSLTRTVSPETRIFPLRFPRPVSCDLTRRDRASRYLGRFHFCFSREKRREKRLATARGRNAVVSVETPAK